MKKLILIVILLFSISTVLYAEENRKKIFISIIKKEINVPKEVPEPPWGSFKFSTLFSGKMINVMNGKTTDRKDVCLGMIIIQDNKNLSRDILFLFVDTGCTGKNESLYMDEQFLKMGNPSRYLTHFNDIDGSRLEEFFNLLERGRIRTQGEDYELGRNKKENR